MSSVSFDVISALERDFGFKPSTSLRTGLRAFAEWYPGYYGGGEEYFMKVDNDL